MSTFPERCPCCNCTRRIVPMQTFLIGKYACGSVVRWFSPAKREFVQSHKCRWLAAERRLDEMTQNRDDLLKVIELDHAEFANSRVKAGNALGNLLDLVDDLLLDRDENRYDELKWQALTRSDELREAEQFLQSLDGKASLGSQSADRQSLNLGAPMSTKQIIAEVVRILSMIAALTPIKIDDTAVAFVVWAQDQEWFIALVERIRPAVSSEELEAQSLMFEPEALAALQLFGQKTGRQLTGKYGELLSLIFQIIAWVKAHQAS